MTPGLAVLLAAFLAASAVDVIIITGLGEGAWLLPAIVLLFVAIVSIPVCVLRKRRPEKTASESSR